MNATHHEAIPRSVLDDMPPVDKPTHLPLRQRWRSALPLPRPPEPELSCARRFIVLVEPGGGEIRAACERTLALGRSALVAALPPGTPLAFGEPEAHRYVDPLSGSPMEPLMFVRVDAPLARWELLAQDLCSRGARLQEVELQARRSVLRAQAALGRLLGFSDAAAATAGEVHVSMWLVRYEPSSERV
jgi:hypothetical protein